MKIENKELNKLMKNDTSGIIETPKEFVIALNLAR